MKLRSKFILFFTFLMAILIAGMIFYLNSYFKNYFKTSALDNFQILAELSESSYFGFIKTLEIRTVDWSSDGYIINTVKEILKTSGKDRESQVKALNSYLKNEKIIYGSEVLIVDILDKDGLVLASSREERIGVDENKEELELGAVRFTEAIQGDFGQTFATSVVAEEDEHSDPMIHITTRIFSKKTYSDDSFVLLDAVILVHFANTGQLRDVLIGNIQQEEDRITSGALMEHYKTADIYLVNKDGLMITPSRLSEKTILKQKVETEPVKACFEEGREIKGEYLDYRGQSVFGASMCLKRDGLALVLEAESQEVLAPLKNISQFLILVGGMTLVLILIGIILLSHWLLMGLKIITGVAEKVSNNDFKGRVKINSKDEIGYLAKVFNKMLDNLEGYYKNIGAKEEELKKEVAFVGLLQEVSSAADESSDVGDFIKLSLEKICAFTGWPVGHAYYYDKQEEKLMPSENWYFKDQEKFLRLKETMMKISYAPANGIIGKSYADKRPYWTENIFSETEFAGLSAESVSGVKSESAFSVVSDFNSFVFVFYHTEPKGLDNEMVKVLSSVGVQLEGVLEKKKTENILQEHLEKMEKTKAALYNVLEDAKESEDDLRLEHHRITAITSSMGECLVVIDSNFKIIFINPVASALLSAPMSQNEPKDWRDVVKIFKGSKEAAEQVHPITKVLRSGETFAMEPQDDFYFELFSGKKIPVAGIVTSLKDGITGAVIIFKNITQEKAIDEAKTNFISTTSHQLRTPITAMKWFSEMLISGDAGKLNEEQETYVRNIYQSAERMIGVVNLLLQIARVEAGRLKVEPVPVDLKAITEGIAVIYKNELELKTQKVEIETEPESIPLVPMDKDVIYQVVSNLLSNAIRYAPPDNVIKIKIINKGGFIEFSINDKGIGIPANQQDRVFEKFFRADNALKAVPEGSGLGLSLVKMLVEMWGGKIWFSSERGDGTTFFFNIPLSGMKPKQGEVKLTV